MTAAPLEADLTEIINGRTGTVRASGRLTEQAADLLRGTLEQLARQGHATVLLDLAEVDEPDGTGASVLRDLRSPVAASGGRLRVVRDRREHRHGAGLARARDGGVAGEPEPLRQHHEPAFHRNGRGVRARLERGHCHLLDAGLRRAALAPRHGRFVRR